jgi:hypothetical protein
MQRQRYRDAGTCRDEYCTDLQYTGHGLLLAYPPRPAELKAVILCSKVT